MKNTGTKYERIAQMLFHEIVNQDAVDTIDIRHNVILQGKRTSHQIDVYWEFEHGGIPFRCVIQAKDWASKVKKSDMLAFAMIIQDLPSGTRGVFVAKSGYQKGAIEVAEKEGISLYIMDEPNSVTLAGFISDISIEMNVSIPVQNNVSMKIDKTWLEENSIEASMFDKKELAFSTDMQLVNDQGEVVAKISDIIKGLCDRAGDAVQNLEQEFPRDTFILMDDVKLRVQSISGEFGYKLSTDSFCVRARDIISYIIRDVISDDILRFDKKLKLIEPKER